MNKFNVGDWVECVDSCGAHGIVEGKLYQVTKVNPLYLSVICDNGAHTDFYHYRFQPKPEKIMNNQSGTVLEEKYIKEFLKKLEYVLWNDYTIDNSLRFNQYSDGQLLLGSIVSDITGVDDIYTYINNSYDQLTSQAAQKRKQELLDKKAALDLELAQINSELEGL